MPARPRQLRSRLGGAPRPPRTPMLKPWPSPPQASRFDKALIAAAPPRRAPPRRSCRRGRNARWAAWINPGKAPAHERLAPGIPQHGGVGRVDGGSPVILTDADEVRRHLGQVLAGLAFLLQNGFEPGQGQDHVDRFEALLSRLVDVPDRKSGRPDWPVPAFRATNSSLKPMMAPGAAPGSWKARNRFCNRLAATAASRRSCRWPACLG